MIVYQNPRRGGKTTAMIQEAAQTDGYIVCFSWEECDRVFEFSKKLGYKIRMPITWKEFVEDRGAYPHLQYHIDNLDMCVKSMTNKRIFSATVSEPEF